MSGWADIGVCGMSFALAGTGVWLGLPCCGSISALLSSKAWRDRAKRSQEMLRGFSGFLGASRRKQQDRREAERELPVFLDILTLGLSAGLSFDASVELYCGRRSGVLAHKLLDALYLFRLGVRDRAEALTEVAADLGVPALESFAATVEEALTFGTPLAQVLSRQAVLIRSKQRSSIEEQIEKVPVKILIPLGTLIVPAMLLAILGPLLGPALATA